MRQVKLQLYIVLSMCLWGATSQASHLNSPERMKRALEALAKTQIGQALEKKAVKQWGLKSLSDASSKVEFSESSKTDAILKRSYDSETMQESFVREVKVSIQWNQSIEKVLGDLAHELTHALQESDWDPYDPHQTMLDHIQRAIEGPGGEMEALHAECMLWDELKSLLPLPSRDRCEMISGKSQDEIKKVFYSVGPSWKKKIQNLLSLEDHKEALVYLNDAKPKLLSAAWSLPYPVALAMEYESITDTACKNTRNREKMLNRQYDRSIATESELLKIRNFLNRRCSNL